VLAVEPDVDTSELDALAALIELVKGGHDLLWEIARPPPSRNDP
jgi:hypothetical protein